MNSIWIARDKNGELWFFEEKPKRNEEVGYFKCVEGECEELGTDADWFPEVTWENSPIELVIKEKAE